jgi:hypothetical protein
VLSHFCSGEREELRFAHYSVQEYLVSDRIPSKFVVKEIEAHRLVTRMSLIYLISLPFPSQTDFPFLRYAAEFWPEHAQVLEDVQNQELKLVLKAFEQDGNMKGRALLQNDTTSSIDTLSCLDSANSALYSSRGFLPKAPSSSSPNFWVNWLETYNPRDPFTWHSPPTDSSPAWYYSSFFGLVSVTKWFMQNSATLGNTIEEYEIALCAASSQGRLAMVQYLVENNFARVDEERRGALFNSALVGAVYSGQLPVVQLLVQTGAFLPQSRLLWAVMMEYPDVVHYLVENGADGILTTITGGDIPLVAVSMEKKNMAMLRPMVDSCTAIDAPTRLFGTALQCVVYFGSTENVRLLLERGANVNAPSREQSGSALWLARERWPDSEIVELLLRHGAEDPEQID